MARKVIHEQEIADNWYLLSQTPKNYDKDNFFIKELQDKVNAEWRFKPNRVDIEYEVNWGAGDYHSLEVVAQTVKSDTGTAYSDDYRRLVFRDIREKRFNIGNKFRFSDEYDLEQPEEKKSYWLCTNRSTSSPTVSVVVQRCTGIFKSSYKDSQGVTHYHSEPVIQGTDLRTVNLSYNEVAVSPQSELIALVQHNQYTKDYFINQRFVIGYDKVYRIKALNKFYAKNTNDPYGVGLMKVYLELTEKSPYDDFVNMIAYQSDIGVIVTEHQSEDKSNYVLKFDLPEVIPSVLSRKSVDFSPALYKDGVKQEGATIVFDEPSLPGLEEHGLTLSQYVDYKIENGIMTISRKKPYPGGALTVSAKIPAEASPTHEEISISVKVGMWS